MKYLKKHYGIIFVLLFAVLASLPLFHSGFYPMHDNEQIARLYDLNSALMQGQFPPRISPNLGFGYGYPFFNFYPSFAYYAGEVFHLFGAGYILSMKLALFVGFLFAAFFAYLLGKDIFDEEAGIVAAAFYTFAPYHAVDVYVRGAYAEFFSFVFLPLVFWAIYKLYKNLNKLFVVFLAAGIACLILSHNLIFLMATPFIGIWTLALSLKTEDKKKFFIWAGVGIILGFGVSAYFSLPSYFERNYTLIRILTSELANYNLHFVCISQLWSSAWGYGGSIPSCADGLSFEVGKIAILASIASIIAFLYYYIRKKEAKNLLLVPLLFVMLAISMFLTVRKSSIIWDNISLLWYIQFPWRFLTLSVLFSSLLSAALLIFVKDKKLKIFIAAFLIATVIVFNLPYFSPEKYIDVADSDYVNLETIRWDTSSLAYEYVPGKIATKKSKDNTTQVDITKKQIKKEPYKIIKGILIVQTNKDLPQEKIFEVGALTPGVLRINTYGFPGWQVYINKKKVGYSDENKLALIDVDIPLGKNTVRAVFEDTPIRKLGNFISIISIISILVIAFALPKSKNEKT